MQQQNEGWEFVPCRLSSTVLKQSSHYRLQVALEAPNQSLTGRPLNSFESRYLGWLTKPLAVIYTIDNSIDQLAWTEMDALVVVDVLILLSVRTVGVRVGVGAGSGLQLDAPPPSPKPPRQGRDQRSEA